MDRLFRLLDHMLGLAFAAALVLGLLSAWPGTAQAAEAWVTASGPVGTEARNVGEFQAIAVSGGINLKVKQGPREAVTVQAAASLLPLLETVVDGSSSPRTLQVRWKTGSKLRLSQAPTVEVTVVQLQSLASRGASDIEVDALKSPQLAVKISGSGDVNLKDLAGSELSISIAGAGDFRASGQVGRLQVDVSGSGDVQTEALKAQDVHINIAGSGDAAVQAERSLVVSIAGSGDVVYRGEPQVKSSIAGSGSVRKR